MICEHNYQQLYKKPLRLFIGLINIDLHISVPPKIPLWAAAVGVKFFESEHNSLFSLSKSIKRLFPWN